MATRISALAVLAALGGATAAAGATITVSTLADNLATDGRVTLREAMLAANTDASVDGLRERAAHLEQVAAACAPTNG